MLQIEWEKASGRNRSETITFGTEEFQWKPELMLGKYFKAFAWLWFWVTYSGMWFPWIRWRKS